MTFAEAGEEAGSAGMGPVSLGSGIVCLAVVDQMADIGMGARPLSNGGFPAQGAAGRGVGRRKAALRLFRTRRPRRGGLPGGRYIRKKS